jgi:hypothetical protein
MSYELRVIETPSHLHVRASGTHTPHNARQFLVDAYEACVRLNRSAVLLEMNFVGPSMSTVSLFGVVAERASQGQQLRRIAYVDASAERSLEHKVFAETVARNRGVNVRFFQSVDEAQEWMQAP